jgi:hypothetical protein
MNYKGIFVVLAFLSIGLILSRFGFKLNIKIAVFLFVKPLLKKMNMKYERTERIPTIFFKDSVYSKGKGDFEEYKLEGIFSDTRFNMKLYCYLYYRDANDNQFRCTMKIYHNALGYPYKVEFRPQLSEGATFAP